MRPDKQMYKAIYQEVLAEQEEFRRSGKERLLSEGMDFAKFKQELADTHTFPSQLKLWRSYYNQYCRSVGDLKPEYSLSVYDWAQQYFADWREETHRTELKSRTPDWSEY